ncbi:beclin-1-like [Ornithodoros turicata]|uniref:Putative beclin-like protein n=1 Tax=Ornithodoros turicata TaxID=34597 RepID=A0A2R5LLW3_9ACAR
MASLSTTLTKDRTYPVNFTCQRCCQPLKLDSSFMTIDDQTFAELSAPFLLYADQNESGNIPQPQFYYSVSEPETVLATRTIEPLRAIESGNGFILVGGNSATQDTGISHRFRVDAQLFDIMTNVSGVDYPICEECTDNLLDQMEGQLDLAEDECKDYKKFLDQLAGSEEDDDLEHLDKQLQELKVRETELLSEIEQVEKERAAIEMERKKQAAEKERLHADESRYWREYANLERQLLLCADDQVSVDTQMRYAQAQLDKLTHTNVFNATFHIWHDGHFGTINNFRLGRLPNVRVEASEINVAWGQTVLLLHSLAKKMDLTFKRYRLIPYGNHSYLESLEGKPRELPLHFTGGFKFLWDPRFDQAMVAFLDCLQQFKEEVERRSPEFSLPYRMDKGKIEDTSTGQQYSIKIQFNSEEQWTKALKFMLTNMKWGLAWVSAQLAHDARR